MTVWSRWMLAIVMALGAGGCATGTGTSPDFQVPAGQYARAFDAVRDALSSFRFELERVDAGAGVISTEPKATAGLATPWDDEQSTLEQELDDLVNHQSRTVRVTFEATGGGAGDLREASGPLTGRIEVVVARAHRPGWRLDTTALRHSSFTRDPELTERHMAPRYTVVVEQDPVLAARLAAMVRKKLASPQS